MIFQQFTALRVAPAGPWIQPAQGWIALMCWQPGWLRFVVIFCCPPQPNRGFDIAVSDLHQEEACMAVGGQQPVQLLKAHLTQWTYWCCCFPGTGGVRGC